MGVETFKKKYGTHYVYRIDYGSAISTTVDVSFESQEEMSAYNASFDGKY